MSPIAREVNDRVRVKAADNGSAVLCDFSFASVGDRNLVVVVVVMVMGICSWGSRDDRAAGRAATPVGPSPTAPARPHPCYPVAPPDRDGVSGAPGAAVKGKVWRAGSAPGDSEHMGAPPQAADRAGAMVN